MATQVSKEYAQDVLNAVKGTVYTGNFTVALLKSAPTVTSGTIDITSAELGGSNVGYSRQTIAVSAFSAASGNNPAAISNTSDILFDYNTGGGNWEAINYAAVLHGTKVLMVISTDSPVTIAPGRRVRIGSGALVFRMGSV